MIKRHIVRVFVLSVVGGCGGSPVVVNSPAGDDDNRGQADKTCTYKGQVYQDQQQWKDDCNSCKCNPEGTTGAGCTLMVCRPDPPEPPDPIDPDPTCTFNGKVYTDGEKWMHDCNSCECDADGAGIVCTTADCKLLAPCGDTTCGVGQLCVLPCCGGPPPMCEPKNDDGSCAAGFHAGCFDGTDGCEADPCTPDPPYCADEAPMGCQVTGLAAHCLCA